MSNVYLTSKYRDSKTIATFNLLGFAKQISRKGLLLYTSKKCSQKKRVTVNNDNIERVTHEDFFLSSIYFLLKCLLF